MGVPKAPSEPNLECRRHLGAKFGGTEGTLGAKFEVPKAPRSQIAERRIEGGLTRSQILDTTKVECTVFFRELKKTSNLNENPGRDTPRIFIFILFLRKSV